MLNRWIKFLLLVCLALSGCATSNKTATPLDEDRAAHTLLTKGNFIRHIEAQDGADVREFYLIFYVGSQVDVAGVAPTGDLIFTASYIEQVWLDVNAQPLNPRLTDLVDAIVWAEAEQEDLQRELTARGAEVTIAPDQSLHINISDEQRLFRITPKPLGYDLILRKNDNVRIIQITNPEKQNDSLSNS